MNGCGQCWDEMKRFFPQIEPLEKWHLNDMKSGTIEQEQFLDQHRAEFPGYPVSWYDWACEKLKAAGLYIVDASRYMTAAKVPASREYAYLDLPAGLSASLKQFRRSAKLPITCPRAVARSPRRFPNYENS